MLEDCDCHNESTLLPVVTATVISGSMGDLVKDKMPGAMERMGGAIEELNRDHGLSEEVFKGMVPPAWMTWALEESGRKQTASTHGGRACSA